jgi:hypothetical protein
MKTVERYLMHNANCNMTCYVSSRRIQMLRRKEIFLEQNEAMTKTPRPNPARVSGLMTLPF